MKDDLWARVRGLGSTTWKGCDWVDRKWKDLQPGHDGKEIVKI